MHQLAMACTHPELSISQIFKIPLLKGDCVIVQEPVCG